MAITKKVHTKGRINVSQGQCANMATANAAAEMKNKIQYNPFDLRFTSMKENFGKNKGKITSTVYYKFIFENTVWGTFVFSLLMCSNDTLARI